MGSSLKRPNGKKMFRDCVQGVWFVVSKLQTYDEIAHAVHDSEESARRHWKSIKAMPLTESSEIIIFDQCGAPKILESYVA